MWGQRLWTHNCLPASAAEKDAGPLGEEASGGSRRCGPSACDSRRDVPRGSIRDYRHANVHPALSVILPSLQKFRIAELSLQEVSETFV